MPELPDITVHLEAAHPGGVGAAPTTGAGICLLQGLILHYPPGMREAAWGHFPDL